MARADLPPDAGSYNLGHITSVYQGTRDRAGSVLTEIHEKVHRDLTFSSTFGFLSFLVSEVAEYHPDPIERYRFRQCKELLVRNSAAAQEGAAYLTEEIDAQIARNSNESRARDAASPDERHAVDRLDAALKTLYLGRALTRGMVYLTADLALATEVADPWARALPRPDTLQEHLKHSANNPNLRFESYTRRIRWLGWWLRRRINDTLDEFCRDHGVGREALSGDAVGLDREVRGALEFVLDEVVRNWLTSARGLQPIVPVQERTTQAQALLDGWSRLLPLEVSDRLPRSAAFTQSLEFYDRSSAVLVRAPGGERIYRQIYGFDDFWPQVAEKELCVCLVTASSYPLVKFPNFQDGRIPDGYAALCISIFDLELPNVFEPIGYMYLESINRVLGILKNWRHGMTVLLVASEDVRDRGGIVLGTPRGEIPCSLRVVWFGLRPSLFPAFFESIGNASHPVRAHSFVAGPDETVRIFAAKSDEWHKTELIAPITETTFRALNRFDRAPWVVPTLELSDYETDWGQLRATRNACERLSRFGFG
jgi:hypothetical protein